MPSRKQTRAADTIKARLAAILKARTTRRYPYMLRGRVESAVFNCPRCNTWLKFRARTAFRKRCPECYLTIYVFIRLCVSGGNGRVGRPVDTILPPLRTDAGWGPMSVPKDVDRVDPIPLEGDPLRTRGRVRASGVPRADADVELFVAETDDESIESMPKVPIDTWRVGEAAHQLVDLDGADDADDDAGSDDEYVAAD